MNRRLTNLIRFVMDECLPPLLRDNRYFMWPFYYVAYGGRNIADIMEFKTRVRQFTPAQYLHFYQNLDSISRRRATDLNQPCLDAMMALVASEAPASVIDVGCGHGYFLRLLRQRYPALRLVGCDVLAAPQPAEFEYCCGILEALPAQIAPSDLVFCSHTLEHVVDLPAAVAALRTLARRLLVIVVPCQRYYYYTLDEHLHFFPDRSSLLAQLGVGEAEVRLCKKLSGDWLLVVEGGGQ